MHNFQLMLLLGVITIYMNKLGDQNWLVNQILSTLINVLIKIDTFWSQKDKKFTISIKKIIINI